MEMTIYTADCTGNERNSLYPNVCPVNSEDALKSAVSKDHENTSDPYENLANAVVIKAAKDHRRAVSALRRNNNSERAKYMLNETDGFFLSDWFTVLTDLDGEVLMCLNDQGGERMDVTEDMTATLRAAANHPPLVFENHSQDSRYTGPLSKSQTVLATFGTGGNNQPLVMQSAGFCTEHSEKSRSIGYEKEKSPTLRAGIVPAAMQVFGICSDGSNSM